VEIIGNGFLAGHLRPLQGLHPDAVALAAGVSWTASTSEADFAREARLAYETAERCRATGRTLLFFSTSSAAVYGADCPGREDDPAEPRNLYGAHKLAIERMVRESGADYLVLRLSHMVGTGQPEHQLLPTLARQLTEGATVRIQQAATRDLIAVAHVVLVINALLSSGVHGEIVNVASGTAVPVEAIVDRLERRLRVTAHRELVDGGAAHLVSTGKLRSLVPEVAGLGFGSEYPMTVIDSYVKGDRWLRQLFPRSGRALALRCLPGWPAR
jgi:nucleoside-diphosphate-sugar epimerase